MTHSLSRAQAGELRTGIDRGWVSRGPGSKLALANAYWCFCRDAGRPWVSIRRRREYATVVLDLFPTRWILTGRAVQLVRALLLEYLEPGGSCCISAERADADKVRIAFADQLAARLYQLASNEENLASYDGGSASGGSGGAG
jgi:hypothetical protein